jgi:carnitine-CoA ligase
MSILSARTDNLAQLIVQAAERSPNARFGTDAISAPLSEAVDTARLLARQLAASGVRKGSTAAFVGVTSENYLVLWMAAQLMGVRTALINPHYPQELLSDMLDDLRPDVVACFDDTFFAPASDKWRLIDAREAWHGAIAVTPGGQLGAAEQEAGDAAAWGLACDGAEVASYMHTSGTSGRPKFCAQSHAYFLKLGRYIADSLGYTSFDTVYAPLPMFHINPLGYGLVAGLTAGASVLGTRRFSVAGFWDTVKRVGATAVVLHATPMKMLLNDTAPADSAGHTIRAVFFGSAEFLERFKIPIGAFAYGSTEAGGLCHLWHVRPGDREMAPEGPTHYAGKPRFDVEAVVSEIGEILVRERDPNSLFSGYLRDGAIDPSLDVHGWFHTGDRGRLDELGNLVFIERMSESIRVNGEYVPIDFVERMLESHAGLSEFAVWSRPDAISGQRVVLWVTDSELDISRTTAAIARLPRIMRPVEIVGIEQLPRDTGVNKVQRRRLMGEPVLWRHPVAVA